MTTTPVAADPCVEFLFLGALPKSASSYAWVLVSALQEPNGRANPARLPAKFPSPFDSLNDELLALFPTGGVYKSHAPCSAQTRDFLRRFERRYIILLRHPADYIAALYCHLVGKNQRMKAAGESGDWIEISRPVARAAVDYPNSNIESGISYLIENGVLADALRWMDDWLTLRDPRQSIVLTYEALHADLEASANRLSYFINHRPASADCLSYIAQVFADSAAKEQISESKYPRGWTGKIGIWRDYFSPGHTAMYNRVVRNFLNARGSATALSEIYPELFI